MFSLLDDFFKISCYSLYSVLYSHYGDSISSKKLNGQQAFECMSLLGALDFVLKQHTS